MGFKGAMDIDFPTEVGPTEETVDALMEYLVGPLLPLKHTDVTKETPSESKQKSVAKQVHAAVVLYNYYHLNHNQESQFLKFDQFCKLATTLKPGIIHHMKYTCQSDNTVLDDPENQLSITEKAIMDACTVSETLRNASANISNIIKEWKVTKVAVLLIDSKKENCFLQFNNGVWSVIEKEVYPENKKRKKIMVEYDKEDLQKLAFLAVKEVAGIVYHELKVLESHVVYSLSQAKTATHFYIVQSTQKINEDNLVPIQDVISSLQGPVVKKCLSSWVITPVVEYYYLLPYAEILSKLFSRESNSLPHQIKDGSTDVSTNQGSQKSSEKVSGNLQKKSKLDSEAVHNNNSSKEKSHDSKDSNSTLKSNQRSTKESDQSKEVSTNLQKRSKLDSELVHISNSVKEEPTDSKDSKSTYKSNQCREKDSGESTEVSDNLCKKSKLDSEFVNISNSVKEEPCDSKDSTSTYKYNHCEKDSGESKEASDNLGKKSKLDSEFVHITIKEEPHDNKGTHTSNQCSEKENGQSKEVSDNLQETSKLDSETVHVSISDKEEPQDGKASKNTYKSNQSSEKESGESKKVSDILQKTSKLDSETVHVSSSNKEEPQDGKASKNTYNSNQSSEKESGESEKVSDILEKKSNLESEIVHISSSSKEESHDSKVSKHGSESNQFSYTFEPVGKVADDAITSQFAARPVDQKVKESENSIGNSITVSNGSGMKNGSCRDELNDSSSGASNKLENDKLLVCFQKENQNTKVQAPLKVYRHVKRSTPTKSTNSKVANPTKDLTKMSTVSQSNDERVNGEKRSCMVLPNEDRSLAVNYILDDFHSTVDAKRSDLSDAALRALLNKRQKLYDQQRVTESELTLCDKKIQAIMHGGIGDCLGLKLEAVIDCCNEICKQDDMQTQQHTNLLVSRSVSVLSGKSLSEAQLTLRKACQELDDICLSNNWTLPTYLTSRSDGGFVANVTVKGANFECSGVSGNQPSIHEARNSAASHVIMRLQQMANGAKTATLV